MEKSCAKPNNMVKSFVITLVESPLSEALSGDVISSANQYGINPEIHKAINGYDSYSLFKKYNINRFLCRTIIDYPGHQGCFLSHFQLWMKSVELNEPILILEHDGIFIRPLPENILDCFVDVLYLDPFSPYDSTYNQYVSESLSQEINYFDPPGNTWHGVGEYVSGAYGYIIKPNAAQKLITFATTIGAAPTDIHIGRNIVDIKSTTATIVRLHQHFGDNIKEISSTEDLKQYIPNRINSIRSAEYLSPKKYQALIKSMNS